MGEARQPRLQHVAHGALVLDIERRAAAVARAARRRRAVAHVGRRAAVAAAAAGEPTEQPALRGLRLGLRPRELERLLLRGERVAQLRGLRGVLRLGGEQLLL